jgi:hypothetical protein
MIPVTIDTRALAEEFSLAASQVDDLRELAVTTITQEYAREWENQANQHLGSTREMYKRAIQTESRGRFTGVAYLDPVEWIANAIEMGADSFDMKIGFLQSNKVKYTKSGDPMLTIPFRFGVSTSLGESQAFASVMPTVIHETTKALAGRQLKLGQIPEQYHIPKSQALRKRITDVSSLPKNKRTSIYEGMQKTTGGYVNFRRVSVNSDPDAFIHPGFSEKNLAQKAWDNFDMGDKMKLVIDDFLSSL